MKLCSTPLYWNVYRSTQMYNKLMFTPAYPPNAATLGFNNMAVWKPRYYRPTWYHIFALYKWDLVIDTQSLHAHVKLQYYNGTGVCTSLKITKVCILYVHHWADDKWGVHMGLQLPLSATSSKSLLICFERGRLISTNTCILAYCVYTLCLILAVVCQL